MTRRPLTLTSYGQMVLAIIFIKINEKNLLKDVLCIVFYIFLSENDTSNDTLFLNVKKYFIKKVVEK